MALDPLGPGRNPSLSSGHSGDRGPRGKLCPQCGHFSKTESSVSPEGEAGFPRRVGSEGWGALGGGEVRL